MHSRVLYSIVICIFLSVNIIVSHAKSTIKNTKIPIKSFAQLKTTSNFQLSPDGTYMAYFVPYQGRQAIVIQPLGEGEHSVIPPSENAEFSWFKWVNPNKIVFSLAFTSRRGIITTRETRLFSIDRNGENFKDIILPRSKKTVGTRLGKEKVPAQIQDSVIDWMPEDPDNILVALDADQDGRDEVRRININTGKFKEIIKGRLGVQNYLTDQQHQVRLGWGYDKSKFLNYFKSPLTNKWKSINKTPWGEMGLD